MPLPAVKALLFMKMHSDRVPRKNVRPLCGRPLFAWIMQSLKKSRYITEIILNTDSPEIADEASRVFQVTIHMRPEYLLRIHNNESNQIMEYDLGLTEGEYFLQTHSTNPLLTSATMDRAIETYFRKREEGYDSLFSVTPLQKRFFWPDGRSINHDPNRLEKTQDLKPIYEENSCLYLFSRSVFKETHNRIGRRPFLFPMSRGESIDIDEEVDFSIAEALLRKTSATLQA